MREFQGTIIGPCTAHWWSKAGLWPCWGWLLCPESPLLFFCWFECKKVAIIGDFLLWANCQSALLRILIHWLHPFLCILRTHCPPLFLPAIMSSFGWVYPTTHDDFNYVYRIIAKMLNKKDDRLRCLTSGTIFINMNPSYWYKSLKLSAMDSSWIRPTPVPVPYGRMF